MYRSLLMCPGGEGSKLRRAGGSCRSSNLQPAHHATFGREKMDLPSSADIFRSVDPDAADGPEKLLTQPVVRRRVTSEASSPLQAQGLTLTLTHHSCTLGEVCGGAASVSPGSA